MPVDAKVVPKASGIQRSVQSKSRVAKTAEQASTDETAPEPTRRNFVTSAHQDSLVRLLVCMETTVMFAASALLDLLKKSQVRHFVCLVRPDSIKSKEVKISACFVMLVFLPTRRSVPSASDAPLERRHRWQELQLARDVLQVILD